MPTNYRAYDLLYRMLDKSQQSTFRTSGYFDIKVSKYITARIKGGWTHVMETRLFGKALVSYCARPYRLIPMGDYMLSRKLAIEADFGAFCETANVLDYWSDVQAVRRWNQIQRDDETHWRSRYLEYLDYLKRMDEYDA